MGFRGPISLLLSLLLPALIGCGAVFVNEGAKDAPLAVGLVKPDLGPVKKVEVPAEARVICDFETGSMDMNPRLFGGNAGVWIAFSWGGNESNVNAKDFVLEGGPSKSSKTAHVRGTLVDKGDFSYPAFTLQGRLKETGYYDASPFTGIQFYYRSPSSDGALKRRFTITTGPTLPPPDGGTCTEGCYNHFGWDLAPTEEWKLYKLPFEDLKRESGWGAPVTPPALVDHLKEFVSVKWDHGANNAAGSYKIDYYVDEVAFF
jgi:hypothetical protein